MTDTAAPAAVPGASGRRRSVAAHDGSRLAVVEVGASDAPACLLAHGAGSSARFITAAFAGPTLAAGRRLVTYDLRGHGASSPARAVGDHHLEVHAADLSAVAATTAEVEVIGGVSLGAHAAVLAVAAGSVATPAATLACLPAWTGIADRGQGPHAAVAAEIRRDGLAAMIARLEADVSMPGWLRDTLLADYPRHDPASLTAALVALDGGVAPTDDTLVRFPTPLAVVGWADDPGHPAAVATWWAGQAATSALGWSSLSALEADGVDALGVAAWAVLGRLLAARDGRGRWSTP